MKFTIVCIFGGILGSTAGLWITRKLADKFFSGSLFYGFIAVIVIIAILWGLLLGWLYIIPGWKRSIFVCAFYVLTLAAYFHVLPVFTGKLALSVLIGLFGLYCTYRASGMRYEYGMLSKTEVYDLKSGKWIS